MFLASPYVSIINHPAVTASISANAILFQNINKDYYTISAVAISPVPGYFGINLRLTLPTGGHGEHLQTVLLNQKSKGQAAGY